MSCNVYKLRTLSKTTIDKIVSCTPSGSSVVFFGEVHQIDWIIECEVELAKSMMKRGLLKFIGLEMFNYRQQHLIDSYIEGIIEWEDLIREYSKSREGFNLEYYRSIIDYAKINRVKLVGVMPPREEAARVARYGLSIIDEIEDSPISSSDVRLDYMHYSDRILSMIPREGPMGRLDPRRVLEAQAYKDTVISAIVDHALKVYGSGLVVTGWAHSEISGSAPTRLIERSLDSSYLVITSRNSGLEEAMAELAGAKGVIASFIALRE